MLPTLTVETYPDLTEQASVSCSAAAQEDAFGLLRTAAVEVARDDWQTIDTELDRRNDLLRVDDPSGELLLRGRFDDVSRLDGGRRRITAASMEKDAIQSGRVKKDTLQLSGNAYPAFAISDILNKTVAPPSLAEGSIFGAPVEVNADELDYGGASVGESIRRLASLTGGEIRYHDTPDGDDNFPVDVLQNAEAALSLGDYSESSSRGSYRADAVTIAPGDGLVDDLAIEEDNRVEITHLQGYGRGDDTTQITAVVVADGYDGGRKVFGETVRTDVSSQQLLETVLQSELEEINRERRHLEVEASVVGIDLALGDFVTVQIPGEEIDRVMRVVELTDRFDGGGATQDALFATRRATRSREQKRRPRRAISEFEKGFTTSY